SSATGSGTGNYTITYGTNTGGLVVAQKALTVSGFAVNGKTYDGTTAATISSNGSLTGGSASSGDGKYVTSDLVSIAAAGSASFNSANVGSRTATGSLTLQDADAGNYTLTAPTASGTINAASVTLTPTAQNVTYGFGALGSGFSATSGTIYNSDITGVTVLTNDQTSTS